jgi:hypothetical protein
VTTAGALFGQKLAVMEIHKNRIADIEPAYFAGCPALSRLLLWGNQLTALPPSLCGCAALVSLQVRQAGILTHTLVW